MTTGHTLPPLLLRHVTGADAAPARRLLHGSGQDPGPGQVFALVDPAGDPEDQPVAASLLVPLEPGTTELRAFAAPQAVTARLVSAVANYVRAAGGRRLVAAADGDAATLLAAGFRPAEGRLELAL